jgi:hypothetical protein
LEAASATEDIDLSVTYAAINSSSWKLSLLKG